VWSCNINLTENKLLIYL